MTDEQMRDGKWTCSDSEEHWTCLEEFDTKEEALEYATTQYADDYGIEPGSRVWVGQIKRITPEMLAENSIDARHVVDEMDTWLYEMVGDILPNEVECTKEQEKDLQHRLEETVKKWLVDNNIETKCWLLEHVSSVVLEDEDAEDAEETGDEESAPGPDAPKPGSEEV